MTSPKNTENELIPIMDGEAVIYLRNGIYQFRYRLPSERKYVRKSLKTPNLTIAKEKARTVFLDILKQTQGGVPYFSMTIEEATQLYLNYRQKDVIHGDVTKGRFALLRTHMKHFMSYMTQYLGKLRLNEIQKIDGEAYFEFRSQSAKKPLSKSTIKNEQSTINSCLKYLNENGYIEIDSIKFRKLKGVEDLKESTRRDTFTVEEYGLLYKALRTYSAKKYNPKQSDYLSKEVFRHWILVLANTGMRTGEALQLKWSDLEILDEELGSKNETLVHINIRAETSKVRRTREVTAYAGHFFKRLKSITQPKNIDDFVFSVDGTKPMSQRSYLYHFKALLDMVDIDCTNRKLQPYSFRHYFITLQIRKGIDIHHIAYMCGTSIEQISKTYFHVTREVSTHMAMIRDFKI